MTEGPSGYQQPGLFGQTPSQTVGPFFHYALPWKGCADLVSNSDLGARPDLFPKEHDLLHKAQRNAPPIGEQIAIEGFVLDGEGQPVPDALLEIWHADATGRFMGASADPNFTGFGRSCTDEDGRYRFCTIKPCAIPGSDGSLQAPHIAVSIFARGLLDRLVTRIYFANDDDRVLESVPEGRRATLIALEHEPACWRFDVVLQGAGETVFFAL